MNTVAKVTAILAKNLGLCAVEVAATVVALNLTDMLVEKIRFKMWEHKNYTIIRTDEE